MTGTRVLDLWLFCAPLGLPSSPDPTDEDDESQINDIKIENVQVLMEVQDIQLTFLVRDSEGNFIRNLSAEDFLITENGHPQSIASLREQEVPISAIVMVDTSWSTAHFLANAAQVAVEFFKNLQAEPTQFVLFSEEPHRVIDWEQGAVDIASLIDRVKPDGKTALYDCVAEVAAKNFRGRQGKKLIILLTDGIDTVSKHSFQAMMTATRQAGVTLYPIIYTNHYIESYRKSLRKPGLQTWKSVSSDFHNLIVMQNRFIDQSLRYGGRAIFSNAFTDLKDIYGNIIHEMKSQYVMSYQSNRRGEESDSPDRRDVRVYTKKIPGKIFIEVSH